MTVDEAFGEHGNKDDQLRMIFMCCHPSLSPASRVTLILKTLCGLSIAAIARALLTTEASVNKRLYRTRAALGGVRFEIPPPEELPAARDTVHTALYLLFNEGHLSTADKPILRELCRDAMQLTQLLADARRSRRATRSRCSRSCASMPRAWNRAWMMTDGWCRSTDRIDRCGIGR